ncbi:hypothetical protein F4861DRAFT_538133 [Xylaria intraflava]|nr:hypothetical protein F4861DRAFT_538133 [Xylaria intraflava]
MKVSVILAAISAAIAGAKMLPPPDNFPACGTTCFGNMLGQATILGCGGGGSTEDAVNGACLCNNINFTYGIIDCSNQVCHGGDAKTVVQYGVNWCAEKGVLIDGLSQSADASIATSPSTTLFATASASASGTVSESEVTSTVTNSNGSPITTLVGTTTLSTGSGGASTGVVTIPVSTTEIVSTLTGSDGAVSVTTLATSTIFSTTEATNGSGTTSGSASGTEPASQSTVSETKPTSTAGDTTESATATASDSSVESASATSTKSGSGTHQTAAPLGIIAAAGLAALVM